MEQGSLIAGVRSALIPAGAICRVVGAVWIAIGGWHVAAWWFDSFGSWWSQLLSALGIPLVMIGIGVAITSYGTATVRRVASRGVRGSGAETPEAVAWINVGLATFFVLQVPQAVFEIAVHAAWWADDVWFPVVATLNLVPWGAVERDPLLAVIWSAAAPAVELLTLTGLALALPLVGRSWAASSRPRS